MAEVVLSPLLEAIIESMSFQLVGKFRLLWGVEIEIKKLSNLLKTRIEATLYDAERWQVSEKRVVNWLRELKDVAYEADDIIDEFSFSLLHSKAIGGGSTSFMNQVYYNFNPFHWFTFRHKIGIKVKNIRKKLDSIETYGSRMNLVKVGAQVKRSALRERPQTDSVFCEPKLYGREEYKRKICEILSASEGGEEAVSVVPLVGMGGLGKTTLAQFIYNDKRVQNHFELRVWICISDDFDLKRLFQALVESITKKRTDLLEMDLLQSQLRTQLQGKKFLLVLDDVWREEAHAMMDKWNRLKSHLKCGANGSKIIVTTRFEEVARIMGTIKMDPLKGLSEDDCFSLFVQWAFGEEGGKGHPNLLVIGRDIAKKCAGVPLAAKSLGCMMSLKRQETEWVHVRDSEIWNLPEDSNGILNSLRVSYSDLPPHLKQCFAYCAIFPKDHVIDKLGLIQLWIAEGFIHSSKDSRLPEDIANEYFNDLLWRSFLEFHHNDKWGNIRSCKMHDLIHDLALSVLGDELSNSITDAKGRTHHLTLISKDDSKMSVNSLTSAKNLRTLFLPTREGNGSFDKFLDRVFQSCKCLRVLSIEGSRSSDSWKLPGSIGNLIHLRYLDLRHSSLKTLPDSICNLHNLQTLILGYGILTLPRDMSCLLRLRHFDISWCKRLESMPAKIGELASLQNLPRFIVSKEKRCGLGELHNLDLRGGIILEKLENVSSVNDAKEATLMDKKNLTELKFFWSTENGKDNKAKDVEQVLECLQPNENLKLLWVSGYRGINFSRWLMDPLLPNLVEVEVSSCKKCEHLPPLGQLPSLRSLILDGLNAIKCIDRGFCGNGAVSGFPSLKTLSLVNMLNLEEWSVEEGMMLSLEDLILKQCPKLATIPRLFIKFLKLICCKSINLRSVEELNTLKFLYLSGFEDLKSVPEGLFRNFTCLQGLAIEKFNNMLSLNGELENLPNLRVLELHACGSLQSFPSLQNCSSLECLHIYKCEKLTSIPGTQIQGLTSLQEFKILLCDKLTCLPQGLEYLKSLKSLTIVGLPKLVSLPEGLQQLTGLELLVIGRCSKLNCLPEWLGNLSSLRNLTIEFMPHLPCLPMGLRRLRALQLLRIIQCPDLEQRCRKNGGVDWNKIAHIPNVDFRQDDTLLDTLITKEGRWSQPHEVQ